MKTQSPKGWYSRGYLPHCDFGPLRQFITLRLFDSLPQSVLNALRIKLQRRQPENIELETMRRVEKYLDQGYGSCFLRQRGAAEIVRDALLHFDGVRYDLFSWVIMPNHIHFSFRPFEGYALKDLMHTIKSYTSNKANQLLGRSGEFWFREYFDRQIRDGDHYLRTVRYIENNPVKAGLCVAPEDWECGSAWKGNQQ